MASPPCDWREAALAISEQKDKDVNPRFWRAPEGKRLLEFSHLRGSYCYITSASSKSCNQSFCIRWQECKHFDSLLERALLLKQQQESAECLQLIWAIPSERTEAEIIKQNSDNCVDNHWVFDEKTEEFTTHKQGSTHKQMQVSYTKHFNQQEVGIVEKGDLKCTFRGVFETTIIMHKKWKKLWNWKALSSNHSLKYLKLIPGYLCSTLIASQPVIPDTHSCTVQIGHVVHQAQEPNISLYWFHTLLWDGTAVTDYECLSLYF